MTFDEGFEIFLQILFDVILHVELGSIRQPESTAAKEQFPETGAQTTAHKTDGTKAIKKIKYLFTTDILPLWLSLTEF